MSSEAGHGGRPAELCDDAARDEIAGRRAVVDVEAPHLAAHVAGVHSIGEAVAVDVDDADTGWNRVVHRSPGSVEAFVPAGAAAVPQQGAGLGVDDVDRVADGVGRQVGAILVRFVAAAHHDRQMLDAVDVDFGGRRGRPSLANPSQRPSVDAPLHRRRVRLTDVERVIEVTAAAHAEEQIDLLIGLDDAVVVGHHLDTKIAVDAVLLAGSRFVVVEVDLVEAGTPAV